MMRLTGQTLCVGFLQSMGVWGGPRRVSAAETFLLMLQHEQQLRPIPTYSLERERAARGEKSEP